MKVINLQSKIFQAFLSYQKEDVIKCFQLTYLNNVSSMGECAAKNYCNSNILKYQKIDIFFCFFDNSNKT